MILASVSRRTFTCAGSLVVLPLLAGAWGCGSTTGNAAGGPPAAATVAAASSAPAPARSRVLSHLARSQSAHFALLRTRPEGLPAQTRRILRTPIVGMNYDLAQRIPAPAPGTYWLVPGVGYLCVVSQVPQTPGVGTVCAKTAQALKDGVATTSIPRGPEGAPLPGARLIVGVAPDGARAVVASTRGAVARIPVTNGLFFRRDAAAAPPDRLTVTRRR
jgi:hypothetical protein